jgi:hypothetical protein
LLIGTFRIEHPSNADLLNAAISDSKDTGSKQRVLVGVLEAFDSGAADIAPSHPEGVAS